MRFVDEAAVYVLAGKGGNGCLSFLREKYRPRGGPDGGNGGDGGSVYLLGNSGLNTLADFRYTRIYRAENGEAGAGRNRFGKAGADLLLRVPLGTIASDLETGEVIGDVTGDGEQLLVARGGRRGLGNASFKSSTNRAPRRTTNGRPGDERRLRLELKVLADIGLLGLPNAGKSMFLSAVSHARPRVADYPFTTLYPHLGVVDVGDSHSFVIADIPGLIAGAADGLGLGVGFLKHLKRTRLLLHLVDIAPSGGEPLHVAVRQIENELYDFDIEFRNMPRWLVLTKIDTVGEEFAQNVADELRAAVNWQGPIYLLSAVTGQGCQRLIADIMQALLEMENVSSTPAVSA